ncbi:MAG: hypothetical protein WAX89_00040, partial [Alphaproteobacteria bacterium]
IMFPQRVNVIEPPDHGSPPEMEYMRLETPDGAVLNGLGFNVRTSVSTVVIALGGNAHDVTGMVRFLRDEVFPEADVAVVGYSYRGYPNALNRPSTGVPGQGALEADAVAIYDDVVGRLKPAKVVVVGYSLGTAFATFVATQRKVDSLILAAPFASMVALAQSRYKVFPARWMVRHPLDTEAILGKVAALTTLVYSEQDGLIPLSHIGRLQAVAPRANVVALTPPVGHGDVLNHGDIPRLFRAAAGF